MIRDLESDGQKLNTKQISDIAAAAQSTINRTLIKHILLACNKHKVNQVHIVGGVSANKDLRKNLAKELEKKSIQLIAPLKNIYCTDNAAMIGAAAYFSVTKM